MVNEQSSNDLNAIFAYLEKPKTSKRLVIGPSGLEFRTLSLIEILTSHLGLGKAAFKNVVAYIDALFDRIGDEETATKFLERVIQFNTKAYSHTRISTTLINHLRPIRLLQKAIFEKNMPLIFQIVNNNIDINDADALAQTALHKACQIGDAETVDILLQHGADVHATDIHGQTPLHHICQNHGYALAKKLINFGANIQCRDNKGRTPLIHACEKKDFPMVELLLAHKAHIFAKDHQGKTPLHYACENESLPLVEFLIKQGADINEKDERGETALHIASQKNNKELVELLLTIHSDINISLSNLAGKTAHQIAKERGLEKIADLILSKTPQDERTKKTCAHTTEKNSLPETEVIKRRHIEKLGLHDICRLGDKKLLEDIIVQGADINARDALGENVLHIAYDLGDVEIIQLLLKKNANPNLKNRQGQTLLQMAIDNDNQEVIQLLMKNAHNLNVNIKDSFNNTPLIKACEKGDFHLAKLLIQKGANVNETNALELTPLLVACENNCTELAEELIHHGANTHVKNSFGRTPLDIAKAHGNTKICQSLEAH